MDPAMRAYGWLLRCYPAAFRSKYEREMRVLFGDQLRDARVSGHRGAVLLLFVHGAIDVIATAPAQHLRKESLVSQPVDSVGPTGTNDVGAVRRVLRALAVSPFVLWVVLFIAAPDFMDPMSMNPPGILGLPAGLVLAAVVLLIATAGLAVVWRTRSEWVAVVTIVVLTAPSLVLITLMPAAILIIQNLAV